MRSLLLALALLLAAACSGKTERQQPIACTEDKDCPKGWVCLGEECADPSTKAVYTAPETAVTPAKVRDDVEQTSDRSRERVDQAMDME